MLFCSNEILFKDNCAESLIAIPILLEIKTPPLILVGGGLLIIN